MPEVLDYRVYEAEALGLFGHHPDVRAHILLYFWELLAGRISQDFCQLGIETIVESEGGF